MAKYDQGGGCSCGLYLECECLSQTQSDGSRTHEGEVFVFSSNEAGRHEKGAALTAKEVYGAHNGIGYGECGQSFAIPIKDEKLKVLPLNKIEEYIDKFLKWAANHPDTKYFVTVIGCGLAGYHPEDIAPMFINSPSNVRLSDNFQYFIDKNKRKEY